jgi:hypothetical protein
MHTQQPNDRESPDTTPSLTVERMRRHLHASRRSQHDLWWAYLLDGPSRLGGAANEPPPEIA